MLRTEAKLSVVLLVFFCASVSCAMLSRGGLIHDDIAHYLAAHYAWKHPVMLVDVWARPAYTVLASPFAQAGLQAARWLNILLSVLACFISFHFAKGLGLREPWLAAAFTALQPLFLQLSFGTLTEPLFGVLLAAATLFYYEKRLASALCMSALPLARAEGAAFAVAWCLLLLRQRQLKPVLCLAVFPALWVVASFVITGDPLYLLHSNPYLHDNPYPEATGADLETKLSHWADYFVLWPSITGPALLPLVSLGLIIGITRRGRLIHAVTIAYFTMVTLIKMTGSLGFQATLYSRFFVSVAPLLGVIAAQAVNYLFVELPTGVSKSGLVVGVALTQTLVLTWWYVQPLSPIGRLDLASSWLVGLTALSVAVFRKRLTATFSAAWLLLVLTLGGTYLTRWIEPYPVYPSDRLCMATGRWFMSSELRDRPLIVLHPSFWLATGRDPFDKSGLKSFELAGGYGGLPESLRSAPDGAVVAWDSIFFQRVSLESLDPKSFRPVHAGSTSDDPADPFYRVGENLFKLVLLEKTPESE